MPKDLFFQLFEPKRLKNINYLDPPPPPPPPAPGLRLDSSLVHPPPPHGSVFSSLGLPILDLVLRTLTCSTDSACSFETSVFSVNHLARIFAHAACRTQRCFKTASDASRCFHFSRFATPPCAFACRILRILPGLSLYTSYL